MGFIRRMLLTKTSWSCPSWAHHQGHPSLTKTKGQTVVTEVACGQLGDLMLLGFGSQQASKALQPPEAAALLKDMGTLM